MARSIERRPVVGAQESGPLSGPRPHDRTERTPLTFNLRRNRDVDEQTFGLEVEMTAEIKPSPVGAHTQRFTSVDDADRLARCQVHAGVRRSLPKSLNHRPGRGSVAGGRSLRGCAREAGGTPMRRAVGRARALPGTGRWFARTTTVISSEAKLASRRPLGPMQHSLLRRCH